MGGAFLPWRRTVALPALFLACAFAWFGKLVEGTVSRHAISTTIPRPRHLPALRYLPPFWPYYNISRRGLGAAYGVKCVIFYTREDFYHLPPAIHTFCPIACL